MQGKVRAPISGPSERKSAQPSEEWGGGQLFLPRKNVSEEPHIWDGMAWRGCWGQGGTLFSPQDVLKAGNFVPWLLPKQKTHVWGAGTFGAGSVRKTRWPSSCREKPSASFSCMSPLLLTARVPSDTADIRCVDFLPHQEILCDTRWLVYILTQCGHSLAGDNTSSHRLRAQSHEADPHNHKMPITGSRSPGSPQFFVTWLQIGVSMTPSPLDLIIC